MQGKKLFLSKNLHFTCISVFYRAHSFFAFFIILSCKDTDNSEIISNFAEKLTSKTKITTMQSDPKQCLYCQNNETLHNLMIEFATLRVSRAFLFKEQTYRGRCLVAYKDHVNDLNELSDEERNAFMADVAQVTRAMQKAFNPEKINYGAYSDKLSHLHFHLAPKYVDGPDYGGTFQMNPGKVYLSDAEYQEMIEKIKSCL